MQISTSTEEREDCNHVAKEHGMKEIWDYPNGKQNLQNASSKKEPLSGRS